MKAEWSSWVWWRDTGGLRQPHPHLPLPVSSWLPHWPSQPEAGGYGRLLSSTPGSFPKQRAGQRRGVEELMGNIWHRNQNADWQEAVWRVAEWAVYWENSQIFESLAFLLRLIRFPGEESSSPLPGGVLVWPLVTWLLKGAESSRPLCRIQHTHRQS